MIDFGLLRKFFQRIENLFKFNERICLSIVKSFLFMNTGSMTKCFGECQLHPSFRHDYFGYLNRMWVTDLIHIYLSAFCECSHLWSIHFKTLHSIWRAAKIDL